MAREVLGTCSSVSANQARTPTRGFNRKMISKPRSVPLTVDRANWVLFSFSPARLRFLDWRLQSACPIDCEAEMIDEMAVQASLDTDHCHFGA